jgi:hypothetical protein
LIRVLCFFLSIAAIEDGDLQRIAKIDQDIFCLEKEKKQLQRKSSSHRDKGGRLQFDRGNYLEARREFFLEQESIDKVHLIEIKIQNLLEEKKDLLPE